MPRGSLKPMKMGWVAAILDRRPLRRTKAGMRLVL
jgi:hypothetical protein